MHAFWISGSQRPGVNALCPSPPSSLPTRSQPPARSGSVRVPQEMPPRCALRPVSRPPSPTHHRWHFSGRAGGEPLSAIMCSQKDVFAPRASCCHLLFGNSLSAHCQLCLPPLTAPPQHQAKQQLVCPAWSCSCAEAAAKAEWMDRARRAARSDATRSELEAPVVCVFHPT